MPLPSSLCACWLRPIIVSEQTRQLRLSRPYHTHSFRFISIKGLNTGTTVACSPKCYPGIRFHGTLLFPFPLPAVLRRLVKRLGLGPSGVKFLRHQETWKQAPSSFCFCTPLLFLYCPYPPVQTPAQFSFCHGECFPVGSLLG